MLVSYRGKSDQLPRRRSTFDAAAFESVLVSRVMTKIHYTRFPVASPQHKRQERKKLARAKVRRVCCVVAFPKFHYNDLLPIFCGLVADLLATTRVLDMSRVCCVANKSATSRQLSRLWGSYGETCVMDFGLRTRDGNDQYEVSIIHYLIVVINDGM